MTMENSPLYQHRRYFWKAVNTFLPGWIHACSPTRYWERRHWAGQDAGDTHGYDKYNQHSDRIPILIREMERLIGKDDPVLDLGCNCGFYLHEIKKAGFSSVTGIDISAKAIAYGKENFGFSGDELVAGSFEEILPGFAGSRRSFAFTYSMGATLELVHPSFDIVKAICNVSGRYVLLIISEWGHRYPRFWEYEFNRQGFLLVKCLRPYDGGHADVPVDEINSLLVFERIARDG